MGKVNFKNWLEQTLYVNEISEIKAGKSGAEYCYIKGGNTRKHGEGQYEKKYAIYLDMMFFKDKIELVRDQGIKERDLITVKGFFQVRQWVSNEGKKGSTLEMVVQELEVHYRDDEAPPSNAPPTTSIDIAGDDIPF